MKGATRGVTASLGLLGGLAAGAGLMYLLDPQGGGRRRALLKDKMVHARKRARATSIATARDLANRSRGAAAELRRALRREEISNRRLRARVRAQLGHVCSHPSAIAVEERDGRVALTGPILADEAHRAVAAIRSVRGVAEVEDRLERHQSPDGVPALQGGPDRRPAALPLLVRPWPPAGRLLAGGAGSVLTVTGAVAGAQRSAPAGYVLAALGAGLLARSLVADPRRLLRRGREGSRLAEEPAAS